MRPSRLATSSGTAALAVVLTGCPAGLPPMGVPEQDASFRIQPHLVARQVLSTVPAYTLAADVHHVTYSLYKGVPGSSLAGQVAMPPLEKDTVVGPLGTPITSLDRAGAQVQDPVTFNHLRRGVTYVFTVVAYKLVGASYVAISDANTAYAFTVANDDLINFGQLSIALQTPFDGTATAAGITVNAGAALPAGIVTTEAQVRPTSNPPPVQTPKGIAADGYVSDYDRHTISRYSVESFDLVAGIPDTQGGTDNADPLQATFDTPAGIFNTGSGLYVADFNIHKIRYLDFSGGVSTIAGSYNFYRPSAVTADGSGNVYVANAGSGEVLKIDGQGVVTTVASNMGILTALVLDGTKLYVASSEYSAIYQIDLASADPSQFTQLATVVNGPYGLAKGSNNRLYYTADDRVRYLDLGQAGNPLFDYVGTGTGFTDGFSRAAFNGPTALCYENGKLHVCDTGNHTIRTVLDAAEGTF
jgi:hypothetical protein